MRFVILHYHILKNAGTTIEDILDRSFGERFAKFDTLDREGYISNAALLSFLDRNPHLRAVSSHHIRYPVPEAPGFIFFDMCFLRDPLDRVRSMYDYFRKKPAVGDGPSDIANQSGLGEFVARLIERLTYQVNDVQVNLLANGGMAERLAGPEDLDLAVKRMLNSSFLGVVDRSNESFIAGQHLLAPVFPDLDCAQPPANVSAERGSTPDERVRKLRDACDPRVYAELLRLNALDFELLSRAREEVERRFQQVPDQTARLRALAERASPAPA
jgi:hypothetical protein